MIVLHSATASLRRAEPAYGNLVALALQGVGYRTLSSVRLSIDYCARSAVSLRREAREECRIQHDMLLQRSLKFPCRPATFVFLDAIAPQLLSLTINDTPNRSARPPAIGEAQEGQACSPILRARGRADG
jgi:hypothetical protein